MTNCNNALSASLPVIGGVSLGAIGSALGAFSGAVGAEILDAAGHSGYHPIEAAKMGAIGGAVLYGASGVLTGALASCGLFSSSENSNKNRSNESIAGYAASMVLTGLTGYGIMNSGDYQTVMELGQTAASFAVGGAITAIPAGCGLVCLALPIVLAITAASEAANSNITQEAEAKYSNAATLNV